MRNPEITKKTSTPTKPPGMNGIEACEAITVSTAIARSPWMSSRCASAGPWAGWLTASPDDVEATVPVDDVGCPAGATYAGSRWTCASRPRRSGTPHSCGLMWVWSRWAM